MSKKSFILVSLGSKIMTTDFLNYVVGVSQQDNNSLDIIFLDELEKTNRKKLSGSSTKDEDFISSAIEYRCNEIEAELNMFENTSTKRWINFMGISEFITQLKYVEELFENNQSFQNSVLSQTYRNLQPILNRRGIFTKKSEIVRSLSAYIICEIALKLYFYSEAIYEVEYAPKIEMSVFKELLLGKYGGKLVKVTVDYKILHYTQDITKVVLDSIHFKYPKSKVGFQISGTSIEFESDCITGILGENGSGKTTVLNLIAGHLAPNNGCVLINGKDITAIPSQRRPVRTVFQEILLFPHLTAFENLVYGLISKKNLTKKQKTDIVFSKSYEYDIIHLLRKFPHELSLGQQQKIAIVRAMISRPKILILDEPTASLDFIQIQNLKSDLKNLHEAYKDLLIIIVSHDINFLVGVCDDFCMIRNGKFSERIEVNNLQTKPKNLYIAKALNLTNILPNMVDQDGRAILEDIDSSLITNRGEFNSSSEALFFVKPEHIDISKSQQSFNFKGRIFGIQENAYSFSIKIITSSGLVVFVERGKEEVDWVLNETVFCNIDPSKALYLKQ